jgi:hypothetical protein
VYVNGRFLDSLILTITRERWETSIRPVVERWQHAAPAPVTTVDQTRLSGS